MADYAGICFKNNKHDCFNVLLKRIPVWKLGNRWQTREVHFLRNDLPGTGTPTGILGREHDIRIAVSWLLLNRSFTRKEKQHTNMYR